MSCKIKNMSTVHKKRVEKGKCGEQVTDMPSRAHHADQASVKFLSYRIKGKCVARCDAPCHPESPSIGKNHQLNIITVRVSIWKGTVRQLWLLCTTTGISRNPSCHVFRYWNGIYYKFAPQGGQMAHSEGLCKPGDLSWITASQVKVSDFHIHSILAE